MPSSRFEGDYKSDNMSHREDRNNWDKNWGHYRRSRQEDYRHNNSHSRRRKYRRHNSYRDRDQSRTSRRPLRPLPEDFFFSKPSRRETFPISHRHREDRSRRHTRTASLNRRHSQQSLKSRTSSVSLTAEDLARTMPKQMEPVLDSIIKGTPVISVDTLSRDLLSRYTSEMQNVLKLIQENQGVPETVEKLEKIAANIQERMTDIRQSSRTVPKRTFVQAPVVSSPAEGRLVNRRIVFIIANDIHEIHEFFGTSEVDSLLFEVNQFITKEMGTAHWLRRLSYGSFNNSEKVAVVLQCLTKWYFEKARSILEKVPLTKEVAVESGHTVMGDYRDFELIAEFLIPRLSLKPLEASEPPKCTPDIGYVPSEVSKYCIST